MQSYTGSVFQRSRHFCNGTCNLLLCALPEPHRRHLLTLLQPVTFFPGEILYEPGERIRYCYFPTNCVISLLYSTEDGATAEMGLVGNEGVFGVAAFLGGESAYSRALVPMAGNAFRLPAQQLQNEFAHPGPLQGLLLRYTLALLTQISQTAVCNRLHTIEQRLCRWLLLCQDRKYHPELHVTQELIANMLGGRRETVTVAAGHLQEAGLIHYCRGRIRILSRSGLEASACECYHIVEAEFDRLLGTKRKWQAGASAPCLQEAI